MDALLFNTGDGGELNIDDNGVETTDGLETAAYLSLFCGEFWADNLQTDSEFKYPNRFWKLYQEIPVVPKNLSRFEDAAKKDLEELPVSSVTVSAQIIGLNKLKLTCQLDEDLFEFTENWDAMREKIGADYNYKAPDPEYLTGLRVLIKDGVNIAPDPSSWSTAGAPLYDGYKVSRNASGFSVYGGDRYDATNVLCGACFIPRVASKQAWLSLSRQSNLSLFDARIEYTTFIVNEVRRFNGGSYDKITGVSPDWTFLAWKLKDGNITVYTNTSNSNTNLDELRVCYNAPLSITSNINELIMDFASPNSNTSDLYKLAIWNTDVSIETFQSWYDLGPTGDPF